MEMAKEYRTKYPRKQEPILTKAFESLAKK